MTSPTEWIAVALMAIGSLFLVFGSVGILKFQDVFLRLQAASKSLTFGFGFLIIGVALLTGDSGAILKAVTAVIFQFLTAPIAAMMIARAALHRGVDPQASQQKLNREVPSPPDKPEAIATTPETGSA